MNRYSRRRRHTRSKAIIAGPLVAFMLIAMFGILLAGCNGAHGPDAGQQSMQDDTFTQQDVARFQQLDQSQQGTDLTQQQTGTGAKQNPVPVLSTTSTGAAAPAAVAVDPALLQQYDAIRSAPSTSGGYQVINSFVNVRSEPKTGASFMGKLNQGDPVNGVDFVNASWAKIAMPGGKTGYASARYIGKAVSEDKLAAEKKAYANTYYVNFGFVNVRKDPQTGAAKIGTIPGQEFVRPLGIQDGWAHVSFQGGDGYVSMQFLAPFLPNFLVRQNSYHLPVFQYDVSQDGMLDQLVNHAAALRQAGIKLITLRSFYDLLLAQQHGNVTLNPGSAVIAVSGLTPANIKKVADTLYGNSIPATLFLQTRYAGISGVTQKQFDTMVADNFDIQSEGHMGDDLRALTNSQVTLELQQSRAILEQMTHKTVFAIHYPDDGVNERVMQKALEAGYLLGVTSTPDNTFTRDELLHIPSYPVTASMGAADVVKLAK